MRGAYALSGTEQRSVRGTTGVWRLQISKAGAETPVLLSKTVVVSASGARAREACWHDAGCLGRFLAGCSPHATQNRGAHFRRVRISSAANLVLKPTFTWILMVSGETDSSSAIRWASSVTCGCEAHPLITKREKSLATCHLEPTVLLHCKFRHRVISSGLARLGSLTWILLASAAPTPQSAGRASPLELWGLASAGGWAVSSSDTAFAGASAPSVLAIPSQFVPLLKVDNQHLLFFRKRRKKPCSLRF